MSNVLSKDLTLNDKSKVMLDNSFIAKDQVKQKIFEA